MSGIEIAIIAAYVVGMSVAIALTYGGRRDMR